VQSRRVYWLLFISLTAILTSSFGRQVAQPGTLAAPAQEPLTIRTEVPLVVLPVTVTDSRGRSIDGLTVADFVVLDNGKPRPAQVDSSDALTSPVALAAVLQTSDISAAVLAKLRKIGGMIQEGLSGDRGEAVVIGFSSEPKVLQGFTQDANKIDDAFRSLRGSGNTSGCMLDALELALNLLSERPRNPRREILLISETRDRGSKAKLQDVMKHAQRLNVTIYSLSYSVYTTAFTSKPSDTPLSPDGTGYIGLITETARLAKKNTVEALTAATGGRHLAFTRQAGLEEDVLKVSKEMHSRYLVSFTPPNEATGSFHTLEIQIKDRPDAIVRTRPGYWTAAAN
jgi:VWFA-related protein